MFLLHWVISLCAVAHVVTAVEVLVEGLTFRGIWTPEPDPNADCPHSYTDDKEATVSLNFTGSHIDLYLPKAGNAGKYLIQIDDTRAVVDGISNDDYMCHIPIYSVDLPLREHLVTVRLDPDTSGFINVHKFVYLTPEEMTAISSRSTLSVASTASGFAAISSESALSLLSVTSTMSVISQRISGGVRTASSSPDAIGTSVVGSSNGSTSSKNSIAFYLPGQGFAAMVLTLLGTFVAMLV